ncbi:MAG: serine acetyltransferase [Bacteroidetes bacterium GWF2_33_38]|nr:MAG: serine acetyltransferase [Bacteroidetes bacterium GWF2_33_38]OFY75215.1 MAG: serine acetyltransferase [Bacteroidetes bacterium RIFOXYA12_FULL_33_9]OFY91620.1 MAG: serine acetyltransferase [Bacteroidetes bacterium RIFOXYA2_FULL_33_7]HBX52586.1 serine acetyltransferase [Bacteroidales bacterium]
MKNNVTISKQIDNTIDALCRVDSYKIVHHIPKHGERMPSTENSKQIIELLREIIFPGYFGNSALRPENMKYYIGVNIDKLSQLLKSQIERGLCFACSNDDNMSCQNCDNLAIELTQKFIDRIPEIRRKLSTDVVAAFNGDPAAKNYGEVIFCYPTIRALTNYRIANELLNLSVPLIPRILTEMAHSETGIDIHPGAQIGESFTIDHGTGVVIGETCIIGNNVKLYQSVTLGAKSFPLDENGNPIKGIPRHPIVEDNVVIYAGATILGRITIGKNSVIGGNLWVTDNVPPNSKIVQTPTKE